MRSEDQHILLVSHLDQILRRSDVVDLAVPRDLLHEWLILQTSVGPIDGVGDQQVIVAADWSGEEFLVRHHEKVRSRLQLRHLVISCLLLQTGLHHSP